MGVEERTMGHPQRSTTPDERLTAGLRELRDRTGLSLPTAATAGGPATATAPHTLPAVPRCHGRPCQGHLPDATASARNAQTRRSVVPRGSTVRLPWSPACGTAWSEVRIRSPRAREVSVR